MTAAASRFGENRTRFTRPSACRTSAHHLPIGFRNCVPSLESGYQTAFPLSRRQTWGRPSRSPVTAPAGSGYARVGLNSVAIARPLGCGRGVARTGRRTSV
jgi:hypothetical protein